jgi:hypothetical protein
VVLYFKVQIDSFRRCLLWPLKLQLLFFLKGFRKHNEIDISRSELGSPPISAPDQDDATRRDQQMDHEIRLEQEARQAYLAAVAPIFLSDELFPTSPLTLPPVPAPYIPILQTYITYEILKKKQL